MMEMLAAAGVAGLGSIALARAVLVRKGLHRWLGEYIRTRHLRRDRQPGEPITVYIAVCDHFEPKRGNASPALARARVQEWLDRYPTLFDGFRDSSGRPPQHTFFYPEDEYEPELVEMVASLCRKGYGEVEIHLHHDNDTPEGLRQTLLSYKKTLHEQHGLLSIDRETGEVAYGFIHGNWALDNSRSDGRWCGVNNELDILRETGCYADFTLPSAPSETQTRTINSIYWAVDDPATPKSHDRGIPVGHSCQPARSLLMIQGPLLLDWNRRKFGLIPGIENGNLQQSQPPSGKRLGLWLRAGVKVQTAGDVAFVKLHTHGVHEPNQNVLLGPGMVELHATLQAWTKADPAFHYRYVTAREMANLALGLSADSSTLDLIEHRYRRPPA